MLSSSEPRPHRPKLGMLQRIKIAAGLVTSPSSRKKGRSRVTYGSFATKGKSSRPMEDFVVAENKRVRNRELCLCGVFDGHLGHDVARYLQANLFSNILGEPDFWTDPAAAIKDAYMHTDATILQKSTELGFGGSTAVTAIVIDGRIIFIANVGDSRAVLCKAGSAIQVTRDHDPMTERKSIESKGGFVTVLPGDVPRVDGQLAVARAFGDKNLKAHLKADPDVYTLRIDENDDYLILASDGLWKVIENQAAVDVVRKMRDPKAAAKQLIDYAIGQKSKDDISCVVVRFQ